jgi:transcriptional regulator with XRE-family HTH domain
MIRLMFQLGEAGLQELEKLPKRLRSPRKGYRTLRPGSGTPLWNQCCILLRSELRPHGSKVRLARYLGISKQRVSDFLAGRSRMPDAETTLRMLHWVAARRAGTDHSI